MHLKAVAVTMLQYEAQYSFDIKYFNTYNVCILAFVLLCSAAKHTVVKNTNRG